MTPNTAGFSIRNAGPFPATLNQHCFGQAPVDRKQTVRFCLRLVRADSYPRVWDAAPREVRL